MYILYDSLIITLISIKNNSGYKLKPKTLYNSTNSYS